MPSDVLRASVKPRLESWHVAQATVPSFESFGSKYRRLPSAMRASVGALSGDASDVQ
jgi:hypothetical protein